MDFKSAGCCVGHAVGCMQLAGRYSRSTEAGREQEELWESGVFLPKMATKGSQPECNLIGCPILLCFLPLGVLLLILLPIGQQILQMSTIKRRANLTILSPNNSRAKTFPFPPPLYLHFTLILPIKTVCSTRFSSHFSRGALDCKWYLHVSIQRHYVNRICSTAHHLTHKSHSETVQLCILEICRVFCQLCWLLWCPICCACWVGVFVK